MAIHPKIAAMVLPMIGGLFCRIDCLAPLSSTLLSIADLQDCRCHRTAVIPNGMDKRVEK
jgi:hypothetical protein